MNYKERNVQELYPIHYFSSGSTFNARFLYLNHYNIAYQHVFMQFLFLVELEGNKMAFPIAKREGQVRMAVLTPALLQAMIHN